MSANLFKLRILEAEKTFDALGAHLLRLIELFPDESQFRQALVRLRIMQNDMDGAEKELRALADAAPDKPEAVLDVVRFVGNQSGADAARDELEARIAAAASPQTQFQLRLALGDLDFAAGRREEASAALRALAAEAADKTDLGAVRLQLARYAFAENNRAEARSLLDEVITDDAKNVEALSLRATMLIDEDKPEAAIGDLLAAAAADPQNVRVMFLLGRAYERNGSPELSIERFAAATRASDYDPEITLAYVGQLQNRNQGPAAETVLREAVRRNPKSAPLLGALAELRLRLKDWDGAAEAAKALSSLQGDERAMQQVQAASLSAQGRLDESINVLQDLAADPATNQAAMGQLVVAYMRNGEIDKAEALVNEALATDPKNLRALLLRADLDLARGDAASSEARLRQMIEAAPDNVVGYTALARLHLRQGRIAEAETTLRDGVAQSERGDAARLFLAQLLESRADFDGAIIEYGKLYESQPDSALVANNLASLLAEHQADNPESIAGAARVAQRLRGSDIPEFQDTYGWILHLQGNHEAALRSLLPAAQALPNNPWVQFHAGMVFAQLGRAAEARQHLEAALSLDPGFPKAEAAKEAIASLTKPAQ